MRLWFTRLIAVMFMASLLVAPQASVLAVDDLPEAAGTTSGDKVETPDSNTGDPVDTDTGTPEDQESDGNNPADGNSVDPENDDDENTTGNGTDNDSVPGDDASEDGAEPDAGDTPETGNELDGDVVLGEEVDGDDEPEDELSTPGPQSEGLIAPLNFSAKTVPLPTYDLNTGMLTIDVELQAGFSAEAGDYFYVEYEGLEFDAAASGSSVPVVGIPGLVAQVQPARVWGDIVFFFESEVESLAAPLSGSVSIAATVAFETCYPTEDPYINEQPVLFSTPTTSGTVWVEGTECPASAEPKFGDVEYDVETGILDIYILLLEPPAPGQQLTLTYEQDKLAMDPGPFDVIAYSVNSNEFFSIATATASNGIITIYFHDANMPAGAEIETWTEVEMTGWLQGGTCATTDAPVHLPGGDLTFVSNTGQTFVESFPSFVCNLAGPGIVGEWGTDDQGDAVIHWTIDTGDIVQYAGVDSLSYMGPGLLVYDCDSLSITTVYGEYSVSDRFCGDNSFYYDLLPESDESFRAMVTVTTALDFDLEYPPLSVVNCVEVWMFDEDDGNEAGPDMVSALASNGWGGEACYELFMDPAGGDFLTKTVDKTEALPGDVVTYTVEVSTSTNAWNVIDVSDALPEGFEIDPNSISCAVEPAIYQTDPCYVFSDSTLRVQVRDIAPDEETPWVKQTAPVTITLTYAGEVTADPNTTVVNEACSVRHFFGGSGEGPEGQAMMLLVEGDQSVVGGGRICSSVSTQVLQADVDPTDPTDPEPTPTTPVDPDPTPTEPSTPVASPTAPIDSDSESDVGEASAITGLPETGQGGDSAGGTALIATLAASILMASLIGIRIRSPRG